jgi:arginyl-tRNA--protein-N-Asp/Glu arginylyltransferase
MFAQVYYPKSLQPSELDDYLSLGWFRMGQSIFTTNFLHFKNKYYSAVWLRVLLNEFELDKAQKKLKKANEHFTLTVKPAAVTPEKEELFARYRKSVSFEASASLEQLLYGKSTENIYNTFEVNIFDNDKLIAVGFFDVGDKSAAGISSFYDPDYKKYSLGKYLILEKMAFCKKMNLDYFYPGYFVPGYSSFDYKLQLSKNALEFFNMASEQWIRIGDFSAEDVALNVMDEKLRIMAQLLSQKNISSQVYRYEFFDANLVPDLSGLDLFDYPLFLFCYLNRDEIQPVIVYDAMNHQYHLLKCKSVWPSKLQSEAEDIFCSHLLKIEEILFSTPFPIEMATQLLAKILNPD